MSEQPCLMKYTVKGFYNSNKYFHTPAYVMTKKREKTPHIDKIPLTSSKSTTNTCEDLFGSGSFYFIESTNNLKSKNQNNSPTFLASSSPIPLFTQTNGTFRLKPNSEKQSLLDNVKTTKLLTLNDIPSYVPSFSRFWKDLQTIKNTNPKLRSKVSFNYFS